MMLRTILKPYTHLVPLKGFKFKSTNSSWSPLAEVFNNKSKNCTNDSITKSGLFDIPELKSPEGFSKLQDQCVSKTAELVGEASSPSRKRKMVEIFDEMSDSLCKVADLAEFIRLAHPHDEYSRSAEKACIAVSEIVEELNTNRQLYDELKKSVTLGDVVETTEVDDLVGNLFLFDFEQNGIHLPEDQRNEVNFLHTSILSLGQQFMAGCDTPSIVNKSEVPKAYHHLFPSDKDNIYVSGLYVDSSDNVARELAYKMYYYPCMEQKILLDNLVKSRFELAKICDFNSYSQRVLRGGMIDNTSDVMDLLKITANKISDFSHFEYKIMSEMKKKDSGNSNLEVWDVPYYVMKAKQEWFGISQEQYFPYFSLGSCMEGLNIVFNSLYGITLNNCQVSKGECWSEDVYKLAVEHETEGVLGYIYCDFFERNGKQNQDCHFSIRGGKQLSDGSYQIPIAVLMLNFKRPTWRTPSLLSPYNVTNLFHEMGHAMHSMLARTKYQHVTGTRCSTDFAEVPSILMEYFASDPRILKMFARHYQTNEPMPEEMLKRLCFSKKVFNSSDTKLQIFYSLIDQLLHGEDPLSKNNNEAIAEVQERYYGLKYVPNTATQLRFSHLVGYGAKYYAYLVSKSVAHSIWLKCFQSDPLNREKGESYRRECLAHGGGKNSKYLVSDFLKMETTPEIFANSLVTELSENHEVTREFSERSRKS